MNAAVIEIWHATASDDAPGDVERLCDQYLSRDDRVRADRFRRSTSRNQHIIGRGMTRRLIGGETIDPETSPFDDEPGGKPRLKADGQNHFQTTFNVSHTPGLVICGLCQQAPMLGVDVERVDRRIDLKMASRYFSPPEVALVQSHGRTDAAREAFLTIWTLKESFIKAIGTGLRTPLDHFAFEQIETRTPKIRYLDSSLDAVGADHLWRFESFHPRPGFIAAAAVQTDLYQTDLRLRDFDALTRM